MGQFVDDGSYFVWALSAESSGWKLRHDEFRRLPRGVGVARCGVVAAGWSGGGDFL